MESISSKQNKYIKHLKALSSDGAYRDLCGEYICDGLKLLEEAVKSGAAITGVLWSGGPSLDLPPEVRQYLAEGTLLKYASPLEESPGPLFTVRKIQKPPGDDISRLLLLDRVQDPGNVGTVIRTACAFGIDAVILINGCADPYNPKTVRSAMGALFRQCVLEMSAAEAVNFIRGHKLQLYGAALSDEAEDIRALNLGRAAVAIGNEGRGLSEQLLELCDGLLVIPMGAGTQSLNAAVSAAIVMWEMFKQ